jgi:hypothetical protein
VSHFIFCLVFKWFCKFQGKRYIWLPDFSLSCHEIVHFLIVFPMLAFVQFLYLDCLVKVIWEPVDKTYIGTCMELFTFYNLRYFSSLTGCKFFRSLVQLFIFRMRFCQLSHMLACGSFQLLEVKLQTFSGPEVTFLRLQLGELQIH